MDTRAIELLGLSIALALLVTVIGGAIWYRRERGRRAR